MIRPPAASAALPTEEEDEWNWHGTYGLVEDEPAPPAGEALAGDGWPDDSSDSLPAPAETAPPDEDEWHWQGTYGVRPEEPAPDPRPVVAPSPRTARPKVKPWWPPSLLYPARAGEGLVMAGWLGTALWIGGTLVPEYCLSLMADGITLGAISVGRFVALISAIPAVFLLPFVFLYWLQYEACVLQASAEGAPLPPRPPGRGLDGLLTGLVQWVVWLVLGAGVGLLPLWAYGIAVWQQAAAWNSQVAMALAIAGAPYLLMALILSFLHDDPLAATPRMIVGKIVRLLPSFLGLCLTCAGLLAVAGGALAAMLALRGRAFWVYIVLSWAAWSGTVWLSMVAMHTLGSYYRLHEKRFR